MEKDNRIVVRLDRSLLQSHANRMGEGTTKQDAAEDLVRRGCARLDAIDKEAQKKKAERAAARAAKVTKTAKRAKK